MSNADDIRKVHNEACVPACSICSMLPEACQVVFFAHIRNSVDLHRTQLLHVARGELIDMPAGTEVLSWRQRILESCHHVMSADSDAQASCNINLSCVVCSGGEA